MLHNAQTRSSAYDSIFRRGIEAAVRLRNRHIFVLDLLMLSVTPALALVIRLEGSGNAAPYDNALLVYTLAALLIHLLVFLPSGLYNRYWRSATVEDLSRIVRAVVLSTGIIAVVVVCFASFRSDRLPFLLPRSLPIIDALLTLIVVGSTRFGVRLAQQLTYRRPGPDASRVLIIGAGNAGQRLVKDIIANPQLQMRPIGFVDDNRRLHGLRIMDLPVLGGRETLARLVAEHRVDQAIIAIPSASGKEIRSYLSLCVAAKVSAKTVPSVSAILEDRVSISEVRDVAIEDLLHRDPIETDLAAVQQLIRGKRVLITGGGGSIGSELCRQVLRCMPAHMALLGHGENSIFECHNQLLQSQREMQSLAGDPNTPHPTRLHPIIADIRFARRIDHIIADFQPDIIFHAAAHKHVPLMEINPTEAIANNVMGTNNLLRAALDHGVEHFVMISTDKAVNPTSVMGASKRSAELLVLEAARNSGRAFVVVRFGNVLGSRGSVVPIFKRQIAAGGPVTVSDAEMTRYFMTIPEAVQLTLQAAVLGRGGEVYMLDMGIPVRIVDLARDLIRLSGLEVGRDIDIVYTGIRLGEKLYEELFVPGERYQPTRHEKILLAANAGSRIPDTLALSVADLEDAVDSGRRDAVLRSLSCLIPEFQPDEARRGAAIARELAMKHASEVTYNGLVVRTER